MDLDSHPGGLNYYYHYYCMPVQGLSAHGFTVGIVLEEPGSAPGEFERVGYF